MTLTKTEWYFIVNPHAGSGKTLSEWIPAEHILESLDIPYITAYTSHKRHAMSLAYDAAAEGFRKIIAVGGDGSIHEVFTGIMKWCDDTGTDPGEFYIGVAPIGSGNDWIKSLNVPHDVGSVIDLIEANSYSKMDVVKVCSVGGRVSYMANIGGIGFDSHVCKVVNIQKETGKRNRFIYLNALRFTIFNHKPINIKVVADDKEVYSGSTYSVALGNGRYSGSGMRQVPLAIMDDGLIDVMIVPKIPLHRILIQLPKLFDGTLIESPDVIFARCKKLEIVPLDEASNDIIELDGEIEGRIPLSIEMDGRQINAIKG